MSQRLKSLADLIVDQTDAGELPFLALEHLESGTGALISNVELPRRQGGEPGVGTVRPGDVLFGKLRPYLAKTLLVCEASYASTELMALRPTPAVESRYLAYLVGSRPIIEWATASSDGTKMPRTSWEKLGEFRVGIVPGLEIQRAIADYLDTETARIGALIAKKQRMIELVRERLRLSPEDALAALRGRCELLPLKFLVRESDRRRGDDSARELLSVSIHSGVVPRTAASDKESRADDFSNYKTCECGDIVLNRMRAFQGAVGVANSPGIVSPDYTVLELGPRIFPDYVHYLMRSHWFIGEMAARIRGIGAVDQGQVRTPRVNFADLREISVPVPTVDEQTRLVADWKAQESRMRLVIDRLERQVQLLSEHRQALITAAVAGELEVPGVAA